ncbi:MAG: hypothetical protein QNJ37_23945 [Crocosphaera sp.]|nr:hypothetical protein [Crocosphaera sp.]
MIREPFGEQREVKSLGSASLDGTPLDYIVVMSAVVTVLAFIPFSITIGSGGIFPLSQGIFPLLGWVLGPVGGALASGIGTLMGVFLAPHTAGIPPVSIFGAMIASFTAGCMVIGKQRKYWWFILTIFFVVAFYLYTSRAMNNGVSLSVIIKGSFIDWSALLLFILPTRTLFARWINSQNLRFVWSGLFLGSWTVAGVCHLSISVITYTMFNWPEEVWIFLIPIMPLENLVRALVGAFIGVRVISGLRAIGIMKPQAAIY